MPYPAYKSCRSCRSGKAQPPPDNTHRLHEALPRQGFFVRHRPYNRIRL